MKGGSYTQPIILLFLCYLLKRGFLPLAVGRWLRSKYCSATSAGASNLNRISDKHMDLWEAQLGRPALSQAKELLGLFGSETRAGLPLPHAVVFPILRKGCSG